MIGSAFLCTESRSAVGAFFDLDYTVLRGSSGLLYLRYLKESGRLPFHRWVRVLTLVGLYTIGLLDFPHLVARIMPHISDGSELEAWRISDEWFDAMLHRYIADSARDQVRWHLSQGHDTIIVSASTPYAVGPVSRELGLGNDYLATHLEVVGGHFTGRIAGQACYGQGKLLLVQEYAVQHSLDLGRSYFYSDSHHDLPLLEAVGNPVAVNPSSRLSRIACDRGWSVRRFY